MLQFPSDKHRLHSGPGWGAGPACLAAPLSPIVVPLLLFAPSLFLCLCLFPVTPPLIFPLSQFDPSLPQFFSACQALPKRLCVRELLPGTEWHLQSHSSRSLSVWVSLPFKLSQTHQLGSKHTEKPGFSLPEDRLNGKFRLRFLRDSSGSCKRSC